ncbi:MAG TPA: hypothetical protein DDZ51_14810 [Planctomycetaceae bacterium]|nr:hypothetical protein [Planctomycetaceae bacterium]
MDRRNYRPGDLSDAARHQLTVGRQQTLDDAIDHIRDSCVRRSKHHFLFLGPRGIGKTHLLACIRDRVERDPGLNAIATVVDFPEESVATLSFAAFLTKLVDLIAEQHPDQREWRDAANRTKTLKTNEDVVDSLSPLFRNLLAKPGRTVVVMLENVHELLERQFRSRPEVAALRKFFMANNGCLLMATALGHFDAVTSVDEPFFDFFDVQILAPLTMEETVDLLDRLHAFGQPEGLPRVGKPMRATALTVHDFFGGNPRWMTLALSMLLEEPNREAAQLIAEMMDQITPVYQATLASLSPQERAALDVLAAPRELGQQPTPAFVSQGLSVSVQQASSLLKRLEEHLISEQNPDDGRSRLYSFRDRVMGLWLGWNSTSIRRLRICGVAELLSQFYLAPLAPIRSDGTRRYPVTELSFFPNPEIELSKTEDQGSYLADVDRMRREWNQTRNQELEFFAESLGGINAGLSSGLSLEQYCNAKEIRLRSETKSEASPSVLAQLAILNYYKRDWGAAHSLTKKGIELSEQSDDGSLLELLHQNSKYLRTLLDRPSSNFLNMESDNAADTQPEYFGNVYVSYAWGDEATEEGIEREKLVDLLCTSMDARGIHVGRDKDDIAPGDSIERFATKIARAKRVVAVISRKSLESTYCMVYELFRAYRQCEFDHGEFQKKLIALVLDDAKPLLETHEGTEELIAFWTKNWQEQRQHLQKTDPDYLNHSGWKWLHTTKQMIDWLPSMLAVINDSVMPRGFASICEDNFADVLTRLIQPDGSEGNSSSNALEPSSRELADAVGSEIEKRFSDFSLKQNEIDLRDCFQQADEWINSGGTHASPSTRVSVLLWMASVSHSNRYLRSHGMGVSRKLAAAAGEIIEHCGSLDLKARLLAIEAVLEWRFGDCSTAYEELADCDHDIAVATRISLLLDRDDVEAACEVADSNVRTERLAEQASLAYLLAGRDNDAIEACRFLRQPKYSLLRYYRCLVHCGRVLVARSQTACRSNLIPTMLTPEQVDDHSEARKTIEPVVSKVRSSGRIETGIESEAISLRLRIAHLLGEDNASQWAELLLTYRPLHLDVLNAIRWGLLKADSKILTKLRDENVDDPETLISCVEMEVFRLEEWETGLAHAEQLSKTGITTNQSERLADIAFQVAAFAPEEYRSRSLRLMNVLVGKEHRFFAMLDAKKAIEEKEYTEAETIMRGIPHKGDPDCLSLLAISLEGQQRSKEALDYLDELCEITGHPQALWRAYRAVQAIGAKERVEPLLERLQKFPSERREALQYLSNLYLSELKTDAALRKAIPVVEALQRIDNEEPRHYFNHAIALRQLGQTDDAIALASLASQRFPDHLDLLFLLAQYYCETDRIGTAFETLHDKDVKDRFWSDATFLTRYLDLAYQAGREENAHHAMIRLREVEDGLPEKDRLLRQASLDELIEHVKGRREFLDELHSKVAQGQLPWSIPAHIDRVPLTAAIDYRTQDLVVGESEGSRAQFITYASNGFCIGNRERMPGKQFVRIVAPPSGTTIVADLTSLITLFRLGVLETTAEFFGKILVPTAYRDYESRDALRLQPSQKHRAEQTKLLVDMLQRGDIKSQDGPLPDGACLVGIDPDIEEDLLPGDLVEWLVTQGAISGTKRKTILDKYDLPHSKRSDLDQLHDANRIFFTAEAVRSLHKAGVLAELTEAMDVVLAESAASSLRGDLFSYDNQASQLIDSRRFWRLLRELEAIEFAEVESNKSDDVDQAVDEAFEVTLAAMKLAVDQRLPFLADDRTLLTAVSNNGTGEPTSAFSSFDAIEQMRVEKVIANEDALAHQRKLMRWRYRFHLPSEELLLYAIKSFRTSKSIVGKPLEEVAKYFQSCMRDFGLHGTLSDTDPPRSFGFELYASWMRLAADLAVSVTHDDGLSESERTEIICWIIDYLAPNIPLTPASERQVSMAENGSQIFFTHVLCQLSSIPDHERSCALISAMRDRFTMSNHDFHQTVSDVVSSYQGLDLEEGEVDPKQWRNMLSVMRRLVVRHALADSATDEGYTVDPHSVAHLEATGAIRAMLERESLTVEALDALADNTSVFRIPDAGRGPLFFHVDSDPKSRHVFPLFDLLTFQDQKTRSAAIQYLLEPDFAANTGMAKRTITVLRQFKRQAIAKTAKTWLPAMLKIEGALRRDWMLNLAGFGQSLQTHENDWIEPFWSEVVCPQVHPAHSVPKQAYFAVSDQDWADAELQKIADLKEISESIEKYLELFRHVPFAGQRSLAELVNRCASSDESWKHAIEALLTTSGNENYLTAFQGCRALLALWEHLSDEEREQATGRIESFIRLSLTEEIDNPSQRRLVILQNFASHFSRWLMFYGPQISADNTASLAWWLADHVAGVISRDIENSANPKLMTERLIKRNMQSVIEDTQLVAQFNGLDSDGSFFHLNSLRPTQGGPFLFSILTEHPKQLKQAAKQFGPATVDRVSDWVAMRGAIGLASHQVENGLVFQDLDVNLSLSVEMWKDSFDERKLREIEGAKGSRESLASKDFVARLLSEFHTLEHTTQKFWFALLKHETYRKSLQPSQFFEFFDDPTDRNRFLASLDDDGFSAVLVILEQLLAHSDQAYRQQLPHLLLRFIDSASSNEQIQTTVHAIIRLATGLQQFSAIEYLLKRKSEPSIKSQLELEAKYTDYVRQIAPPWAWALARPLHQLLKDNKV